MRPSFRSFRQYPALLAATALLLLAGCSGRIAGTLLPVETKVAGTTEVEMIVATTRQKAVETPDEMFNGERSQSLSFADITVSIPPESARTIGAVQWPASTPGNPATDFVTTKARITDAGTTYRRFGELVAKPGSKGRALVFVHGYNSNFDAAVMRFAQIVHDSGSPGVPVLFTWPSRGRLTEYPYDYESASYSRDSLEDVLFRLSSDPRIREVGVLAHSMGNWVTMEALRTMALKRGRVHPKIRNVMLAAPDLDLDVFRTQMEALGKPRPEMTVFVSQDDKALDFSRKIWGDLPRLGSINPALEPYRSAIEREKVTVIDLTKLNTGDQLAHTKFAQSPEIVRIIGQRMSRGQVVDNGRNGLGERTGNFATGLASTVGSATVNVLTAPINVLDGSR